MHRYLWAPRAIATRTAPNGEVLDAALWVSYLALLDMSGTGKERGLLTVNLKRLAARIGASVATARRHRDTLARVGLIEHLGGQRYRVHITKSTDRLSIPTSYLWATTAGDCPPRWGADTTVALRTVVALMHRADWPKVGDSRRGVLFPCTTPNESIAASGAMSHSEFKRGLALLTGETAPTEKAGWDGRTGTAWLAVASRYDAETGGSLPSRKVLDWSQFPAQMLHSSATPSCIHRPRGVAPIGHITSTSLSSTSSQVLAVVPEVTSPEAPDALRGGEALSMDFDVMLSGDRPAVEAKAAQTWAEVGGDASRLTVEAWESIVIGCVRHARAGNAVPVTADTLAAIRRPLRGLYAAGWRPATVAAYLTHRTAPTKSAAGCLLARIAEMPTTPVQHLRDRGYWCAEADARIGREPVTPTVSASSDLAAIMAVQGSRRDPAAFTHVL